MRTDSLGRPLPQALPFCDYLKPGAFFVFSNYTKSFDSRYFGPIQKSQIIGVAKPLWMF
jgi:type IV secretory pathway protease TraF